MMDSNACKKTTTLAVSAIIATAALITAGAIASPVLGAKSKKGASSISTKSSSSDLKKLISCLSSASKSSGSSLSQTQADDCYNHIFSSNGVKDSSSGLPTSKRTSFNGPGGLSPQLPNGGAFY
ncbi:MAG TPA: hypothetical protein VFD60_04310, partial [Nitrososphaeraceae archaeon]|nr:hypothetical protein [Nitrososphaeraceae archaeon]